MLINLWKLKRYYVVEGERRRGGCNLRASYSSSALSRPEETHGRMALYWGAAVYRIIYTFNMLPFFGVARIFAAARGGGGGGKTGGK